MTTFNGGRAFAVMLWLDSYENASEELIDDREKGGAE